MQVEDENPAMTGDWRHVVATGLYQTGLLRAFSAVSRRCELVSYDGSSARLRRVQNAKYVILAYHGVGPQEFPLYCRLSKRAFADQMWYIKRNYRVVSLPQMVEELHTPVAEGQSVVVTFDDGYLGTYADAFPVLRECGIPATVYLTAGAVESGELAWYDQVFLRFQRAGPELTVTLDAEKNFHLTDFTSRVDAATTVILYLRTLPDEKRRQWCETFAKAIPLAPEDVRGSMMNWDQVREMQRAGIFFGSHTLTHPVLSRLTPEAVQYEVAQSKWLIENRTDAAVEDFAFPFGKPHDCGEIGATTLGALGLRSAMTTTVGVNQPGADQFRLRRMVLGDESSSIGMFAFRLQRLFFHSADEEAIAVAGGVRA